MVREGADGLDVGGESTRPGASRVSPEEQIARVVPVIRGLRERLARARAGRGERAGARGRVVITIDTTRAAVAAAALDAGADAVNDVSGGRDDEGMMTLCARRGAGLILMHRARPPSEDSFSHRYGEAGEREVPRYDDVVREVKTVLAAMIERALAAGMEPAALMIDPGLGFGKTVEQNLELIRRGEELLSLGRPVLSGLSRKSFVGRAMTPAGEPVPEPQDRLAGTLVLSLMHVRCGASVLRVHDVAAHRAVLGWKP